VAVLALMVEAGVLEAQARLLTESIRLFAGAHSDARIIAISPRPARRPSRATIARLNALGAEYLELDIDSALPEYGTSWRVHAAAEIERRLPGGTLVVLDSDMFFAAEPDLALGACAVAARPVDMKGMCTTGPGDAFDPYWRKLCGVCDVDYDDIPFLTTTVDRVAAKASYNGGFVVVDASAGVFQRTEDFFLRVAAEALTPWGEGVEVRAGHGMVRGRGAQFWGSAQACLSLAAWGAGARVRELPASHNFPAHLDDHVQRAGMREPMVAVHYHHLFENGGDAAFHRRLHLTPACRAWLERQVRTAA